MIYDSLKPEQRALRSLWEEMSAEADGRTIVTTDTIVLRAVHSALEDNPKRNLRSFTLRHVRDQAKASGLWHIGQKIAARRWREHVDPVRDAHVITNDPELAKRPPRRSWRATPWTLVPWMWLAGWRTAERSDPLVVG